MLNQCSTCGPNSKFLFDAASIRERDFEGMWFDVSLDNKGNHEVTAQPQDLNYLSDFNMPKILKEAKSLISDGSEIYCSSCLEVIEF